MKRFRVKTREVWIQDYFIDAESPEEARDKVQRGLGTADDLSFEFSHRLDSEHSEVSETSDTTGTIAYQWQIKFDSLRERPDALHEPVLDLEVERSTNIINGSTLNVLQSIVEVLGTTFAEKRFQQIYADATVDTPDTKV